MRLGAVSIRTQLIVATVLLISIIFTAAESIQVNEDYRQYQKFLQDKTVLLTESYASSTAAALWNVELGALSATFSNLLSNPDLVELTIKLADGGIVYHITGNSADTNDKVVIERPVTWIQDGTPKLLGYVNLALDRRPATRYLLKHLWQSILTLVVVLAVVVIALFLTIKWLTGPLIALTATVEELAKGNYAISIPVHHGTDEVISLSRAIRIFKENAVELNRLRHSLETEVDKKTLELINARNAAEAGNQAKSEFLSTMSHELRTPLTAILGALNLLRQQQIDIPPKQQQQLLDLAFKNGNRLLYLVNDILDLQKIESGKMEYNFEPVNIVDILADAIKSMVGYCVEYNTSIQSTSSSTPIIINGDRQRISQVIINLLSNAIKFSPHHSTILVSATQNDEMAVVSVMDQGPGISDAFRSKIFSRFSQQDSANTRAVGGTGLGLNISKAIIDAHGGTINFKVVPKEEHPRHTTGTYFYFSIPLMADKNPQPPSLEAQ